MSTDIGNECVDCRRDTSLGSGLFVNRIPADRQDGVDDEHIIGYLCPECQEVECDICDKSTLDYDMTGGVIITCHECMELEPDIIEGWWRRPKEEV